MFRTVCHGEDESAEVGMDTLYVPVRDDVIVGTEGEAVHRSASSVKQWFVGFVVRNGRFGTLGDLGGDLDVEEFLRRGDLVYVSCDAIDRYREPFWIDGRDFCEGVIEVNEHVRRRGAVDRCAGCDCWGDVDDVNSVGSFNLVAGRISQVPSFSAGRLGRVLHLQGVGGCDSFQHGDDHR